MLLTICSAYRGSKVAWDGDECSASLAKPEQPPKVTLAPKKKEAPLMNRFQLLNMDESENDLDSDDDTSGVTLQSTFAPSTIAV